MLSPALLFIAAMIAFPLLYTAYLSTTTLSARSTRTARSSG